MKKALFILALLVSSLTISADDVVTTQPAPSNSATQVPGRVNPIVSEGPAQQAAGCIYATHCGTRGMTVSMEFFDGDLNEFLLFLKEISEIECGEFGPVSYDCH